MHLSRKKTWVIIAGIIVLAGVVLALPPVWSRVTYYSRDAYAKVKYWLNPPSAAVFVPSGSGSDPEVATAVAATLNAYAAAYQPSLQPTATPGFHAATHHLTHPRVYPASRISLPAGRDQ